MLVTEMAYRDMTARLARVTSCLGWLLAQLRVTLPAGEYSAEKKAPAGCASNLRLVEPPDHSPQMALGDDRSDAFRWRKHPQLLKAGGREEFDIEDLERGARSSAVRGLFLARCGRFDEAKDAFVIAALEPSVDLTAIPGFWELSRAGMMAAESAYESAERFREASALAARIRRQFRPRLVPAIPVLEGSRAPSIADERSAGTAGAGTR